MDLAVSLTPKTLSFYHRVLRQSIVSLRIPTANVIRTFIAKGVKDPVERLQVLKVLDVISLLETSEAETRDTKNDVDLVAFRAALGGILSVFGCELILFIEEVSSHHRFSLDVQLTFSDREPRLAKERSRHHDEFRTALAIAFSL